jgi:hypothetical protein
MAFAISFGTPPAFFNQHLRVVGDKRIKPPFEAHAEEKSQVGIVIEIHQL